MLRSIFDTDGFPPRWNCGPTWRTEPWWGWLHIISDVAIWGAYFAIPLVLLYLVRRRQDLLFPRIVYLFAIFICACGLSHLVEAGIFYWPVYRFSGLVKFTTAVVSWVTVAALFPVVPKLLTLRSVTELEAEVARRTRELSELAEQLRLEAAQRALMNNRLREKREMLQLALAIGDIGFFSWDVDEQTLVFDEAQQRLTGIHSEDGRVSADDFFARIDPEYQQAIREQVGRTIEHGDEFEVRFPYTRNTGERIWMAGRATVTRDEAGKVTRMIGLNQDITDHIERESHLNETAKEAISASKQKSRFVAAVSHEIRTPLTAMLGCVDALLADMPTGDTRRVLRTVRSQGEMLRILLNDVLDLSKIEAGKLILQPRQTDLIAVLAELQSLMEPLASERGLTLSWHAVTGLPRQIEVDPLRLRQVMLNLVSNAIKYTLAGSVVVEVGVAEDESAGVTLVLAVRDTGVGIPADRLEAIFQEYEQVRASESGTGLGLAICYRLMAMMGGSLEVESKEGMGSVFTAKLPLPELLASELIKVDSLTLTDEAEGEGGVPAIDCFDLKVLAAEDTRAIQFVLRRLVGAMVRELKVVENGRLALEAIDEATRQKVPYDLILMDIQMPEIDGITAIKTLRRSNFDRPIVALTAGSLETERQACIEAGCSYFLPKPIDVIELKRVLQEVSNDIRPV